MRFANQLFHRLKVILTFSGLIMASACSDDNFSIADILPEVDEQPVTQGPPDEEQQNELEKSDNLAAFGATLHQSLIANCSGCHDSLSPPFIATSSAEDSLKALLDFQPALISDVNDTVGLDDSTNAYLVRLMTESEHQCRENCDAWGSAFSDDLEKWKSAVDARFSSGISLKDDVAAYEASLHSLFITHCQNCHDTGATTPAGSPDALESYFALDRTNRIRLEDSEPGIVLFIESDHFSTKSISPDVQAAATDWKAAVTTGSADSGEQISKANYTANIHPLITAAGLNCTGCHNDFANSDVDVAYDATIANNLINLTTPAASELSAALVDTTLGFDHSGTCGTAGCDALQQSINDGITASQ